MHRALQYDLLVSRICPCGGLVVFDGKRYVCESCMRIVCHSCKHYAVQYHHGFICTHCSQLIA
ncbi:MAG: hypothetical protein GY855_03100 [candidate division Zixibacteria bacterium]|nr:hypothetical protein [candidate division Zixibacteria bacterium]